MRRCSPPWAYGALDPIRVVEAVTAGVAFLAAGSSSSRAAQVHGLTTGAGMWLAGAIGVACGLGMWQIALFATLLALIVLGLLYTFESQMDMNQGEDFTEDEQDEPSKARQTKTTAHEAKPGRIAKLRDLPFRPETGYAAVIAAASKA